MVHGVRLLTFFALVAVSAAVECYVGRFTQFGGMRLRPAPDQTTMRPMACGAGQVCQLSRTDGRCFDGNAQAEGKCVDKCVASSGKFSGCTSKAFITCCSSNRCNDNKGSAWPLQQTCTKCLQRQAKGENIACVAGNNCKQQTCDECLQRQAKGENIACVAGKNCKQQTCDDCKQRQAKGENIACVADYNCMCTGCCPKFAQCFAPDPECCSSVVVVHDRMLRGVGAV